MSSIYFPITPVCRVHQRLIQSGFCSHVFVVYSEPISHPSFYLSHYPIRVMNPSIGALSKWKYLLLLKLQCAISFLQEDDQKRKKSTGRKDGEPIGDTLHELRELSRRIAITSTKMIELEEFAEKIQQAQRHSTEFQMQLTKLTDASELEKGVTKGGLRFFFK